MEHLAAELGHDLLNAFSRPLLGLENQNEFCPRKGIYNYKRGIKAINEFSVEETQQKLMMRIHQICSRVVVRHHFPIPKVALI